MTSASKKRRRRREREKRTEELLQRARAISLVDVASPVPTIQPSTTDENFRNQVSNDLIGNQVLAQHSSAVDNPVVSPTNLPKEPSWKRIDFVLPRADGKKRFVFDRQIKSEDIHRAPSSQNNGDVIEQKSEEYRKSETIEDILFAGKRQKERITKNNIVYSTDQDESSRKKATLYDKQNAKIIESQRRKLECAFESLHQAETTLAIGNDVDIPKTNEHNVAEKNKISKVTLATDDAAKNSDEKHDHKKKSSSINITQLSPGQISGRTVKEAVRDKRGLRPRANSTDGELNLPRGGLCDERMVLEAHKWNTERKFTNLSSPRGFHNLGNTCFLNATLQCLTYLPPLCQTLIDISNNKHDGGKRKMPQGQRITSSLCNLFQQAHGLNNSSSKVGGPFAPKKVVNHLSNIGSCGSRNGYKFRLGRQEDAHEFLVHLLDAMNDGELRAAGINQTVSGWRDRLPVPRLDETTFIHRIFGGYFRSQVRCRRCNYKSNTYDPFLDLSLEVSKKSSTSVLRALSEFTRKETLDAANQWKCSGCKKYVCATKQLTVFRPPLTLCIQLKRFAFNSSFGFGQKSSKYHHGYGGGGSKITKPIEFPGTLQLPLSDNRSCQYTLTGIVIHVGGSSQSGHYTAYVKKPGKNGTSQWYHMDDSHVQPVSEKTVLKQKDAYLLFYCRTEVKLEFPDPPSRSMSASEATEFGRTRAIARANSLPSQNSKKDPQVQYQIDKDNDNEAVPDEVSAKKLSRSQDQVAIPCSKTQQKATVHRVKTKIHPLGCSDHSPQTDYVEAVILLSGATGLEKSGSNFSSSPASRNEVLTESHSNIHRKEEKKRKIDTIANSEYDASSDDSSYNESLSDTNSSSDSDSSSQKENPICSDIKIDNPSTHDLHKSVAKQENKEAKSSSKEDGKFSDKKPNEYLNSSKRAKFKDETDIEGESSSVDEDKIARVKGNIAVLFATESSKQLEDTSESGTDKKDDSFSKEEKKTQNDTKIESKDYSERNSISTTSKRTQVVRNNTDSRGKVKVLLGPRKRKVWESIACTLPSKGSNFQLLGNMKVSQWDDGNDGDNNKNCDESTSTERRLSETGVDRKRRNIIDKIEKYGRSRKRKMHLDRWDSHLDQGKLKKVKSASNATPHQTTSTAPKTNIFQRIQSGVQRINRGKPKGQGNFRRKFNNKKGRF